MRLSTILILSAISALLCFHSTQAEDNSPLPPPSEKEASAALQEAQEAIDAIMVSMAPMAGASAYVMQQCGYEAYKQSLNEAHNNLTTENWHKFKEGYDKGWQKMAKNTATFDAERDCPKFEDNPTKE